MVRKYRRNVPAREQILEYAVESYIQDCRILDMDWKPISFAPCQLFNW